MSKPTQAGSGPVIKRTKQETQNHSFDEKYNVEIVEIMGEDTSSDPDALRRIRVDANGRLQMVIVAEDVASPGTYVAVQGQYNSDGYFELLTAGSGGTGTTTDDFLMEDGSFLLLEDGDNMLLESSA